VISQINRQPELERQNSGTQREMTNSSISIV
jgi:hypothetical protein